MTNQPYSFRSFRDFSSFVHKSRSVNVENKKEPNLATVLLIQMPNEALYRDRISELVEVSKEEAIRYNEKSEADFWRFIKTFSPVKSAGLILTDDGNLIAIWDGNNGNYFDIEFMGDTHLEYVAYNNKGKHKEGSGTIDCIPQCVYKFNLENILGIRMEQQTIERHHNVVRYVGRGKMDPITGNITREAFSLRKNETGVSVNWLEYFTDVSKQEQLQKIRSDMKVRNYTVGPKGAFAELNIGDTTDTIWDECGIEIWFNHVPRYKNPSHALLLGMIISSKTEKSPSVVLAQLANKNVHPVAAL